jgi:hypothetical protein
MADEAALGVGVEQRCAGHEQKLAERHGMDCPLARWTGKLLAQLQQLCPCLPCRACGQDEEMKRLRSSGPRETLIIKLLSIKIKKYLHILILLLNILPY